MAAKICSCFLFNIVKICPFYLSKAKKRKTQKHFISNCPFQFIIQGVLNSRHLQFNLMVLFLLSFTSYYLPGLGQLRNPHHSQCLHSTVHSAILSRKLQWTQENERISSPRHVLALTRAPRKTSLGVFTYKANIFSLTFCFSWQKK